MLKNNKKTREIELNIQLNDKLDPIDVEEYYEEPLETFLKENNYGEIIGGGTMQSAIGEIKFFDIQVLIYDNNNVINEIKVKLESLGAPKGSFIEVEGEKEVIQFGTKEGLAIYLDGVKLPKKTYNECDSNYVVSEIFRLTGCNDDIIRFWEGNKETAIYFYGDSFDSMKRDILEFINTYPLCKGARIVRIA
ncbi:MAG: hypothetical protein ACRCXA_11070 [Peptostreptococcaceae bacterium]